MAPKEGNSIVKHGVLDERLNVHGVKNLKVADLSICPDNVGCNTYSTALLIGEKCAMLTAEDLGYSGKALDMKVSSITPRYRFLETCAERFIGTELSCSWGTFGNCLGSSLGVTMSKNVSN
jgi:hypothetical protein